MGESPPKAEPAPAPSPANKRSSRKAEPEPTPNQSDYANFYLKKCSVRLIRLEEREPEEPN